MLTIFNQLVNLIAVHLGFSFLCKTNGNASSCFT